MTLESAALRFAASCPNGRGWKALCPICQVDGGTTLNLRIRDDQKGRWRLKCDTGCEETLILAAVSMVPGDQFVDAKPMRGLSLHGFAGDFKPVVLEHLIKPYVPKGKCILFDADGGVGKTSLIATWAAALSRGQHPTTFETLPDGPVRTLYLHKGEDGSDEIETIYRANGGVPGMLLYYCADDLRFDANGIRLVKETIEDGGFGLVVADAFFYFLEGVVKDTSDNLGATNVVHALTRIMRDTGAGMINIRHTVKDSIGKEASNLGMGSTAFRNAHRGQLVARLHPDQKSYFRVVWVEDKKGSLLNERGEPFAYTREGNELVYVQGVADPFGAHPTTFLKGPRGKAAAFLSDFLSDGPKPFTEIEAAGKSLGHSVETLRRAKDEMNVASKPRGKRHWWMLAKHVPAWDLKEEGYDAFADE